MKGDMDTSGVVVETGDELLVRCLSSQVVDRFGEIVLTNKKLEQLECQSTA